MNKEVANHFQYRWWAYLLTAVLVIGLWLSVFEIISKPKATEKIGISFIGKGFNAEGLEKDLPGVIKSNTSQNIKQINVESIEEDNVFTLDNIIVTRSQGTTDIFIWSGELKQGTKERFASLDEAKINSVIGDVTYYRIEGEAYALSLSGNNNFSKYYSGSEDCWLLVSAKSVNFGGANGKGLAENDAALQIAKYLLGAV